MKLHITMIAFVFALAISVNMFSFRSDGIFNMNIRMGSGVDVGRSSFTAGHRDFQTNIGSGIDLGESSVGLERGKMFPVKTGSGVDIDQSSFSLDEGRDIRINTGDGSIFPNIKFNFNFMNGIFSLFR